MSQKIKKIDQNKPAWEKESDMVETYEWLDNRIDTELKHSREGVFGKNIESVWAQADRDYLPHRLENKGRTVFAQEDDGYRSSKVTLYRTDDWQSDISQPDQYIKIQTALSILIDRNPEAVFRSAGKQFEVNNTLVRSLYQNSWEIARSKQTFLKPFVFNLAKYGFGIGRVYPRYIARTVKDVLEYDPRDVTKNVYKDRKIVEYDDIYRENLDPYSTWLDDMATADNYLSARDWAWEKYYSYDEFIEEFEQYPNAKFVVPKSFEQKPDASQGGTGAGNRISKSVKEKNQVRVTFYENRIKDIFAVRANDIWIFVEPLPSKHKKLSCIWTYWTLRHPNTPYGIGLLEAMREDKVLYDRLVNMTMDQLTLSIYKMFFHSGTEQLDDTGEIPITPGVGRQVNDPTNITWVNVPGPGPEAWKGIEFAKQKVDEDTGINAPLAGEITGKTATEVFQAKEAALKRMKAPLENIVSALEEDAWLSVKVMEQIYSVPDVVKISDPDLIDRYLQEINQKPELWFRDPETGEFYAKLFREVYLNVEQDEEGNVVESEKSQFLRVTPAGLRWEGIINIKGQSILVSTKELEKQMKLEMANIIIPLLPQPYETVSPTVKQILRVYEEAPEDWFPLQWLQMEQAMKAPAPGSSMFVPQVASQPPQEQPFLLNPQMAAAGASAQAGPLQPAPQNQPAPQGQEALQRGQPRAQNAALNQTRQTSLVGRLFNKLTGQG